MVELHEASRWYGDVIGVNDVTLSIGPGATALLGQNGAGKTTLMRLLTGQLRPTTGTVRVFGQDPFANPSVFRRLGYCPDSDAFPEHLSGRAFVKRMATFAGYSMRDCTIRTEEALVKVGMSDRSDRPIKGYSKGMRQRIKLAQALVHDPELLLLDEPLNGLDPVARRDFMSVLRELLLEGRSIVVSSHVLFEVEQMTRAIILLHRGRLLAQGDVNMVRGIMGKRPKMTRIASSSPRRLAAHLVCQPFVVSCRVLPDEKSLEVESHDSSQFLNFLMQIVLEEEIDVQSFEGTDESMEAVYQYLVAR